jgi:Siderophore-interacting protein
MTRTPKPRNPVATTHLTVTGSEVITPRLRRLWFHSDDLSAFADSRFTDRYVKLLFPQPGVDYPHFDVRALRAVMPPDDLPVVRTYTALSPDIASGTLAIDFVLHGVEGVAGPWAAAAREGNTLMVNGPGGAYSPDPTAQWHLLVGDESALPAIGAALAALPDDAEVRVVALVDSPEHQLALSVPAGGHVTWVHRSADDSVDALSRAVEKLDWPEGRVHVFAHGEAEETMRSLRPYLLKERAVSKSDLSISGYWRRGRTEEGFRAWKAEVRNKRGTALSSPDAG